MRDDIKKKFVIQLPIYQKAYCPRCGESLICIEENIYAKIIREAFVPQDGKLYKHKCPTCQEVYELDNIYPLPVSTIDEELNISQVEALKLNDIIKCKENTSNSEDDDDDEPTIYA